MLPAAPALQSKLHMVASLADIPNRQFTPTQSIAPLLYVYFTSCFTSNVYRRSPLHHLPCIQKQSDSQTQPVDPESNEGQVGKACKDRGREKASREEAEIASELGSAAEPARGGTKNGGERHIFHFGAVVFSRLIRKLCKEESLASTNGFKTSIWQSMCRRT
jgi:hypothetical protein